METCRIGLSWLLYVSAQACLSWEKNEFHMGNEMGGLVPSLRREEGGSAEELG